LKKLKDKELCQVNMEQIFRLLSYLKPATIDADGYKMICECSLCGLNEDKTNYVLNPQQYQKEFSNCWLAFLSLPMKASVYQAILECLHQKVLPYMFSPTSLMDFMVDAYDNGIY
jgi:hypothetical protein